MPDDGKLCAMASIDPKTLLVLEQSDDGDAKLYRCEVGKATNVLGDDRDVDGVRDLAQAGVKTNSKNTCGRSSEPSSVVCFRYYGWSMAARRRRTGRRPQARRAGSSG